MEDSAVRTEARSTQEVMDEFSELLDIPLSISLEVGRRRMKVREILLLKQESVVEVPKSAGENIDIYVNGRLVAFGEILEMEGKAGIRLTDFVSQN
jgi:flagellar motor switch protein FliN